MEIHFVCSEFVWENVWSHLRPYPKMSVFFSEAVKQTKRNRGFLVYTLREDNPNSPIAVTLFSFGKDKTLKIQTFFLKPFRISVTEANVNQLLRIIVNKVGFSHQRIQVSYYAKTDEVGCAKTRLYSLSCGVNPNWYNVKIVRLPEKNIGFRNKNSSNS